MFRSAANADVGVGFQFGARPFHASIRTGNSRNIQLQISKECRATGGAGDATGAGKEVGGGFHASIQVHTLDNHPAGEKSGVRRAGQTKSSGNEPAHAFGVADAYAVGTYSNVIAQR